MSDARRSAMLRTMGVDVWRLRDAGRGPSTEGQGPRTEGQGPRAKDQGVGGEPNGGQAENRGARRSGAANGALPQDPEASALGPEPSTLGPNPSVLNWEEMRTTVARCEACGLHQGRTQAVFGVGSQDADLMIIGEAPGAEEDRQGEPFVGRAGQLLNAMLAAIGLARERVYIANIVKCRPPGNRDPHADEAAACQGYLLRQIELTVPKLILSVGRISAHNLLHTEDAVGRLRGRTHRFQPGDIPLIVTYHPAYLLRRPEEKAKAWQDLQAAHRVLRGSTA